MSGLRLAPSLDLTSLFSPNLALNGTLGPNLDFAGVLDNDLDFAGVFDLDLTLNLDGVADLDLDLGELLDFDLDRVWVLCLAGESALDPNLNLKGTLNIESLLLLRFLAGDDKSATLRTGDNSSATISLSGRSAKVTLIEPSRQVPELSLSSTLLLLLPLSLLCGAYLLGEMLS